MQIPRDIWKNEISKRLDPVSYTRLSSVNSDFKKLLGSEVAEKKKIYLQGKLKEIVQSYYKYKCGHLGIVDAVSLLKDVYMKNKTVYAYFFHTRLDNYQMLIPYSSSKLIHVDNRDRIFIENYLDRYINNLSPMKWGNFETGNDLMMPKNPM